MKTNRIRTIVACAVASLQLTAAGQNTLTTAAAPEDRVTSTSTLSADTPSALGKANKASSLIGMDVRNAQNEKLGEIKDLAVDLKTGKIGYAVLSVGGFLGIGEKYIAVPPSAFSVEGDRVVLNADKAKIQNAPAFSKTSWPEVNNPSLAADSNYWRTDRSAQGTSGSTHVVTGAESSPHTSTPNKSDSSADSARHDRSIPSSRANTFRGQITSISPEAKTMTVKGPAGSRQFRFSEKPTVTFTDNNNPRISDLKAGYTVDVGFHEDNGTYVADSVQSETTAVR